MIKPVASRLRHLLEEDPRRSSCSLLITGHSAGGAVASLIYSHMLATTPETSSELNTLTGCFRRIHCVTFGAPPVSLLPLSKPTDPALKKSLFLSFVNEGDPVARAEKAYVRSLLDLYVHPAPIIPRVPPQKLRPHPTGNKAANASTLSLHKPRPSAPIRANSTPENTVLPPIWPVPPATLSNAGRLILLRSVPLPNSNDKKGNRMDDGVQARSITDEHLREVVWGDPVCHMMKVYARRIEVLATNAVVGRG
jgi:Lipase (class 3)